MCRISLLAVGFTAILQSVAQAEEIFDFYNDCTYPIRLYIKASNKNNWGDPQMIQPGCVTSTQLVSNDTFDLVIQVLLYRSSYREYRADGVGLKQMARSNGQHFLRLKLVGLYHWFHDHWIRRASSFTGEDFILEADGNRIQLHYHKEPEMAGADVARKPNIAR